MENKFLWGQYFCQFYVIITSFNIKLIYRGIGLGLVITKKIVNLIGPSQNIVVESQVSIILII